MVTATTELLGLAILAGTVAVIIALGYRWATRERVPVGLAVLSGVAGVAVYLNATTVLGQVTSSELDSVQIALFTVAAFFLGGVGALAGHRWGDAFGQNVIYDGDREAVDEEVSRLVQTVGRVTTVTLPQEIDDVVGYDPVTERTRETIAGKQFVFPQNLTVSELDSRLRSRLKTDFGVGTVDLELGSDGSIEHLGVGSRAAGIGPTLPPATNAVAITADPAFAASTGDVVQVWEADAERRVLTGELRGIAGDVVTVAINSADTPKVDPTRTYRLVTLPVEDRPAREFASLLRTSDESYTSVSVKAGSPLHGMPVGALAVTVVGVTPEEADPVSLPSREYVLSPDDQVSVIGNPPSLRKLETAATPLDPSLVQAVSQPTETTTDTPMSDDESGLGMSETTDESAVSASSDEPQDIDLTNQVGDVPEQPTAASEGEPTAEPPLSADSEPDTSVESDSPMSAEADTASFEDLKAEYEEGEEWNDEGNEQSDQPIENHVGETDSGDFDATSESTGDASFDDLKEEFDSGDADWNDSAEDDTADNVAEEVAFQSESDPLDDDDELVSLEDADISFEDSDTDEDAGDGSDEFDAGFGDAPTDNETESPEDDLSSLAIDDDDEDEELFDEDPFEEDELFEDDAVDDSEADEETVEEDDQPDDDSESDSGGGGSTFAQLKEEFESGDADWEEDVSDSPGGDMRLDE
nr:potassium transporter TrkA [Halovenus rubra]